MARSKAERAITVSAAVKLASAQDREAAEHHRVDMNSGARKYGVVAGSARLLSLAQHTATMEGLSLREALRWQPQTGAQPVISLSTGRDDAGATIQAAAVRLQAEHPGLSWSDAVRRTEHAQPRLHALWREELADRDWK